MPVRLMKQNKGFTLIEIMIALMLGLIIIGATLNIYISTIRSSADISNSARLNYDLDSAAQLMLNDIRRAGYWGGAISDSDANVNPFTNGNANIQISDYTDADGVLHSDGCIFYTYDSDNSDSLTEAPTLPTNLNSYYGFRFDRNSIWVRSSVTAAERTANTVGCGNGNWNQIINEQQISVTALTFDNSNSQCSNVTTSEVYVDVTVPIDTSCAAAIAAAAGVTGKVSSGDTAVETQQIDILLQGNVVGDVAVTKSLTAIVKIRNERVFTQP